MRIFMAHPKSWSDEQIDSVQRQLAESISRDIQAPVSVIPGRDDFRDNIYSAGTFSGWTRDVVSRINTQTRKPFYDAFVAVTESVGRATRDILVTARRDRPVFFYNPDTGTVHKVVSVEEVDPEDMVTGWVLDHEEIG